MRNVFPVLSVLFFTKKKCKTAELFVVSHFWEKWTMKNFHFSTEDIQERVWSLKTRCWLLEEGETGLILDIKTAQEFEVLMSMKKIVRPLKTSAILKALSVYTPNLEMTEKLFHNLDPAYIIQAIDVQSSVFDWLNIESLCGKSEALDNKVNLLIQKRPNVFCEKVMQWIMKTPPQKLSEAQKLRFSLCCAAAQKANICVVKEIAYINVFFPNIYEGIRERAFKTGTHFGAYFAHLFPQLLPYMEGENDAKTNDAKLWYERALSRLDDAQVQNTMASVYGQLKGKLSESAFKKLTMLMLSATDEASTLKTLLGVAPEEVKSEIRRRLSTQGVRALSCFPFKDWESEYAKSIIEAMILADELKDTQLPYLSEELRQFAVVKLEEEAQVVYAKCVNMGNYDEKELCAIAECTLIRRACECWEQPIISYIEKYSLKEDAALYLLRNYSAHSVGRKMVQLFVENYPLTQNEYYALLVSPCKDLALFCRLVEEVKATEVEA